jgi:hypothetical protein
MKLTVSEYELSLLIAALTRDVSGYADDATREAAGKLLDRMCELDETNDGPECEILSVERQ